MRSLRGQPDIWLQLQVWSVSLPHAGALFLDALAAGPLDLDELARRMRIDRSALRARLVSLVLSGAVVDRGDGRLARGSA